jgi:endonuclease/exonuclease/phosphatase family metal-dependent hydrolase
LDGRRDPGRIAQVIRNLDADIIGLQEVDSQPDPEKESYQMDYLANVTGLSAVSGPTMQGHTGDFGNVLLTSRRILDIRRIDLSVLG